MSIKDWKDKELNTLLNEKWGFSMDLSKLNENKKPDFPDVDGDGDRKEPISKAQKDKKAKGGDKKPKKKAKKGEIPPQLRNHVKGKQKNKKGADEKEEVNEISMRGPHQQGGNEESDKEAAERIKDGAKNIPSSPEELKKKKNNNDNTKTMKEGDSDDNKEKFKKGLRGELDDSADQKVDPKLKQKIIDSLTVSQLKAALAKKEKKESRLRENIRRMIKKKIREQQETPDQQNTKLASTSGGRYSSKDEKMKKEVELLIRSIIKDSSRAVTPGGIETVIQKMIAILGSSDNTLSQTKSDMAKVKDQNKQ